jgi:hypothetical protein
MTKIITRLFDTFPEAQAAVTELERLGVPHGDISLVSNATDKAHTDVHARHVRDHTAGEAAARDAGFVAGAGGVIGAAGGALAGLGLLAIPGLGPVVAAGWLVSTAVGALAGGAVVAAVGGLVGALTHAGVSEEEAHVYAEGVRRGGALVSAKVADDKVAQVETALLPFHSVDIVVRGHAYRASGWTKLDKTAPPYTAEEAARNREQFARV